MATYVIAYDISEDRRRERWRPCCCDSADAFSCEALPPSSATAVAVSRASDRHKADGELQLSQCKATRHWLFLDLRDFGTAWEGRPTSEQSDGGTTLRVVKRSHLIRPRL